jgi:hypothetical protein
MPLVSVESEYIDNGRGEVVGATEEHVEWTKVLLDLGNGLGFGLWCSWNVIWLRNVQILRFTEVENEELQETETICNIERKECFKKVLSK